MPDYSGWDQYTRDAQGGNFSGAARSGSNPSPMPYSPAADQFGSYNYNADPSNWGVLAKQYGFDQALAAGQVQAGPQFALNQNSSESLAQQIALLQASQGQQAGYLNQDYQTGLAKLGLSGQGLDVQRGALARQPEYLKTLHDLANQSYQQSADVANRSQMSSATARGSVNTPGNIQHLDDISTQLANQLSRSDTQYNEQVASLSDQNKMLDLQSQNLGLDRAALKTELERGLDRLGLNTSMSIAQLTEKMNSNNIEDQILAQQIFNNALQASDYYAQQWPGVGGNTSPPGTSAGSSSDAPNTYYKGPQ